MAIKSFNGFIKGSDTYKCRDDRADNLGTASAKNAISVVTDSTDLVESGAVKDIVGWGNKNLLTFPYSQINPSFTREGVTYTTDGKGIITATSNGATSTGRAEVQLHGRLDEVQYVPMYLPIGKYKFGIMCSNSNIEIRLATTYNGSYVRLASITGNNVGEIEITANTQSDYKKADGSVLIAIYLNSNTATPFVWNNIKIYPFIVKDGEVEEFEPYHESVEQTLRDAEVVQGKNLLPLTIEKLKALNTSITWNGNTCERNGITYTIETDNYGNVTSINANGAATATSTLLLGNDFGLSVGETYRLSGCPADGGAYTYHLAVYRQKSSGLIGSDNGNGFEFEKTDASWSVSVYIEIWNGQTINKIFYPMVTVPTETTDFEPYYIPLKDVVPNKCDSSVIAPTENGSTIQKSGGYAVGSHAIRNGAFITWKNAKAQGETINDASDYTDGDVASDLDYEEYTGSFTFDNVSCGYGIKKVGRNVSIYIYMPNVTLTNGTNILFTLPSEYIPLSYARVFSGIGISSGDWASAAYYNYCLRVNTNGSVILCGDNISNIKYVIFSAEYII